MLPACCLRVGSSAGAVSWNTYMRSHSLGYFELLQNMAVEFQGQVSWETGSGNCKFPKIWPQKVWLSLLPYSMGQAVIDSGFQRMGYRSCHLTERESQLRPCFKPPQPTVRYASYTCWYLSPSLCQMLSPSTPCHLPSSDTISVYRSFLGTIHICFCAHSFLYPFRNDESQFPSVTYVAFLFSFGNFKPIPLLSRKKEGGIILFFSFCFI